MEIHRFVPKVAPCKVDVAELLNDRTADAAHSARGLQATPQAQSLGLVQSESYVCYAVAAFGRAARQVDTSQGSQHRMLIMPTRPRWATLRIESAELEPAFMVGDVCLFDPDQPVHEATPLDGRVVVLTIRHGCKTRETASE